MNIISFALSLSVAWAAPVLALPAAPPAPTMTSVADYEGDLRAKTLAAAAVCEALRTPSEKMAYESGDISPVCKPFVKLARKDLDRCGDVKKDPYSAEPSTTSLYTWASRNEMDRRGKINLYTDPEWHARLPGIEHHIADLKTRAADLCCGSDGSCKQAFERVDVSFCQPQADPNAPDACVFGGSFKVSGAGYTSIFQALNHVPGEGDGSEIRRIAEHNLTPAELHASGGMTSGQIVLSSYIPKSSGADSIEPVLLHEFGHACSMIHMQQWALESEHHTAVPGRALRGAKWIDGARSRCNPELALPDAYYDFWTSLGETHELAACLYRLTVANQKQQVDHPCPALCPGHYLEESVGIAFSLLVGGVAVDGVAPHASVFPNTCDHVRDGQHPMVSDVADCLVQNSPHFREKLRQAYRCSL